MKSAENFPTLQKAFWTPNRHLLYYTSLMLYSATLHVPSCRTLLTDTFLRGSFKDSTLILIMDFFLMVLGFELRVLCLLSRCCITWAMAPVFFNLTYFAYRGSYLCPGWPGPWYFYLSFPPSWMTGTCHHVQQLVEMESHELFDWAVLKPRSSQSPPPKWHKPLHPALNMDI
jgi:hypothetical protein